jgi:hypothetical protein
MKETKIIKRNFFYEIGKSHLGGRLGYGAEIEIQDDSLYNMIINKADISYQMISFENLDRLRLKAFFSLVDEVREHLIKEGLYEE